MIGSVRGILAKVRLFHCMARFDRYTDIFAERLWFFVSTFRNAFVIIVLTIASWLFCRHRVSKSGKYPIKILETVPRGFRHVGPPVIDSQLVSALASELPVATIILLLEHIAISKCKSLHALPLYDGVLTVSVSL